MDAGDGQITDAAVLDVIKMNLPGVGDTSRLSVDTNLWDAGMDSLSNIAVMAAVEQTYDVEFPDELLTREVFSSVRTIANAIRSLSPGHGA